MDELNNTEGDLQQRPRARAHSSVVRSSQLIIGPCRKMSLVPDLQDQYTCKICLQNCEKVHFCKCTGGMMCHLKCLIGWLQSKGTINPGQRCQICKYPYKLVIQKQTQCSWSQMIDKAKGKPMKCVLYVIFFVLLVAVLGYLVGMFAQHKLSNNLVVVGIVVMVCVCIVLGFLAVIWICDFLMTSKYSITSIQPLTILQLQGNRKSSVNKLEMTDMELY